MHSYTIELDIVPSDEEVEITEEVVRNEALGIMAAIDTMVEADLITLHGPGGGWPVVSFTGTREQLIAIIAEWDENADAEHYFDAFAKAV